MFYFGYCTFLDPGEMRKYMPDAKVITKGYVQNSSIKFVAIGDQTHVGRCHIDFSPDSWGKRTVGVVIEHPEESFVDYPDFKRISLTVHGHDGNVYDCWTLILENPSIAVKQAKEPWRLVTSGLEYHGFSKEECQAVYDEYNKGIDTQE